MGVHQGAAAKRRSRVVPCACMHAVQARATARRPCSQREVMPAKRQGYLTLAYRTSYLLPLPPAPLTRFLGVGSVATKWGAEAGPYAYGTPSVLPAIYNSELNEGSQRPITVYTRGTYPKNATAHRHQQQPRIVLSPIFFLRPITVSEESAVVQADGGGTPTR